MYTVIQGKLSKSLPSLWRRLSCPYTEFPCCVYIGGEVRLSNPCWVFLAAAQQILALLVEGGWSNGAQQSLAELVERGLNQLVLSCVSLTLHSICAESTSCPLNIVWSYVGESLWYCS